MRRDLAHPVRVEPMPWTWQDVVKVVVGAIAGAFLFFVGGGLLFALGSVQ